MRTLEDRLTANSTGRRSRFIIQIRQMWLAILAECESGFSSGQIYGETLAIAVAAIPINEISIRLGIGDQAHLATAVERHAGTTPRPFRE